MTIGNDLLARFISHVLRPTFHIRYFMFRIPHFVALFEMSCFVSHSPSILHPTRHILNSIFYIPHSTSYIPHSTSYISHTPHCSSHSMAHIPSTQYFTPTSCIPHLIFHILYLIFDILYPTFHVPRIFVFLHLTFLYNNSILFNWNASNCRKSLA